RACRLLHMPRGRRELGRVEHDEVEASGAVAQLAQFGEYVGVAPRAARIVESVPCDVVARLRQGLGRAVDSQHRLCAAGQRRDGKAARIAKAIQDVAAHRQAADATAILALVEKESGFLAGGDIDAVVEMILEEAYALRQDAVSRSGARRQALEAAYLGIGALVDCRATGGIDQRGDNAVAPCLGARVEQLHDDDFAIAVGDHAGKPVGFGMHETAAGVRGVEHRRSCGDGGAHAAGDERVVDRLALIEAPYAGAYRRGRAPGGRREELAVGSVQLDGFAAAGRTVDGRDRAGEHPGMLQPQRLFAPGVQRDAMHALVSDQAALTPNRWPTAKVTAAASAPSSSMRIPDASAPRPVNSDRVAPTPNSASAVSNPVIVSALARAAKMNGSKGIPAPTANDRNDDTAACQGDPSSSGLSPSSSRASVSSAWSGSATRRFASRRASPGARPFAS